MEGEKKKKETDAISTRKQESLFVCVFKFRQKALFLSARMSEREAVWF